VTLLFAVERRPKAEEGDGLISIAKLM